MKKFVSVLFLSSTLSFAGLVDAVSLVVNNEAITLYEIDNKMMNSKLNKADAVSSLIDEILYNQELKNNNIKVDIFDVNNYLEQLAARNGMDIYTFKSIVKQKYQDFSIFEAEVKKQILRDKLTKKIVAGKLKIATDDDMKIYYENNKEKYSTASKIDIVQYVSKNRALLERVQKNPLFYSEGILKEETTLDYENLNSQVKYLINDTKTKSFSAIFVSNGHYVMLYIKDKRGLSTQSFESVKNSIFQEVMQSRESAFLKEYFEKLKLTAEINVIR